MTVKRIQIPFNNQMTRLQTILGWIYLPIHILILPFLLSLYAQHSGMSEVNANLLYECISIVFILLVMIRFLRVNFDVLCDNVLMCLSCILIAFLIESAFSLVSSFLMMLLTETADNPNDNAVMELAKNGSGVIEALTIFVAPIVEEVLFRGVAFGSIRPRSRSLAYVVSILLFSLCHVWQYAIVFNNVSVLFYAIQYIPISIALAWAYERSGCIWTSIFFHMGYNAVSFIALSLL